MPALTQTQLSKMIIWINQGALNNACSSGCDTAVFTYAGAVAPLMNTYCKGCHNPASLGGGVDLSTYAAVKSSAAGKLLGSIKHAAGISAMPKGSNPLSDCQIRQVEKWIQAGTPNN
jgi:mono/diheme cytochrome c family protein